MVAGCKCLPSADIHWTWLYNEKPYEDEYINKPTGRAWIKSVNGFCGWQEVNRTVTWTLLCNDCMIKWRYKW